MCIFKKGFKKCFIKFLFFCYKVCYVKDDDVILRMIYDYKIVVFGKKMIFKNLFFFYILIVFVVF